MGEIWKNSAPLMLVVMAVAILVDPSTAHAATTGAQFKDLYEFASGAATGYLGKSIAIIGGLVGLGLGAVTGKAMTAISGIVLACVGMVGPKVIDQVFSGAII